MGQCPRNQNESELIILQDFKAHCHKISFRLQVQLQEKAHILVFATVGYTPETHQLFPLNTCKINEKCFVYDQLVFCACNNHTQFELN